MFASNFVFLFFFWRQVLVLLVVGSFVGVGEILKLEPRVCDQHPVLYSVINSGSYIVFLPLGLKLRGLQEMRKLCCVTFVLACLWQWCITLLFTSLAGLSVATSVFIFQAAAAVVYPLSICILNEKFLWAKVALVCVSIGGLGMIVTSTKTESNGKPEQFFSYIICTVSMLFYASYQVFYARMVPELPDGSKLRRHISYLTLILGMRGLFSWLIGMPMLLLVKAFSEYTPEPGFPNGSEVGVIIGSIANDWLFNFAFIMAIVKFSPLWITMGCTLNIPLSVLIDCIFNSLKLSFFAIFGAVLIVGSFMGLTFMDYKKESDVNPKQELPSASSTQEFEQSFDDLDKEIRDLRKGKQEKAKAGMTKGRQVNFVMTELAEMEDTRS
tara:strand:+ start:2355 stop:3503 length:1149 start_codon:yes stop_codon:yes gene_type:complete